MAPAPTFGFETPSVPVAEPTVAPAPTFGFETPSVPVAEPTVVPKTDIVENIPAVKPDIPVYKIPNEYGYENTDIVNSVPVAEPTVKKDVIKAISSVRETIKYIESQGFKVDAEEIDFEDIYQVIIKIEK